MHIFDISIRFMNDVNKNIAIRIRSIRLAKGYSQDYIAAKLGVPQNTYSRFENGNTKITIERLVRVANILEESIYSILNTATQQHSNTATQQHSNTATQQQDGRFRFGRN